LRKGLAASEIASIKFETRAQPKELTAL